MTEQGKSELAKIMYESSEKCSFQFEHCWHLLKDQPKWIGRSTKEDPKRMKTMSPSPTPTLCSGVETVDSVFDLEPDNVIDNDVIELDQPMRGKAEKGKRKAKGMAGVETVVLSRLEYTLLVNKISQEDERLRLEVEKMEIDKEKELNKIRQEDERLRLEAEKVELTKKEADRHIMMMDVSAMPALQRLYFEELQREIIARRNDLAHLD